MDALADVLTGVIRASPPEKRGRLAGVSGLSNPLLPSVTLRVPFEVHRQAKRLATFQGCSIGELVATALDAYERDRQERALRERLIVEYHVSIERFYADPEAAAEYEAEMRDWDPGGFADPHGPNGIDL